MTDAEMAALPPLTDAQMDAPTALTDAEMDAPEAKPPEKPGYIRQGLNTIAHSAGSAGKAFKVLLHQAGERAKGAVGLPHEGPPGEVAGAQLREMGRGFGDVATLGYGNRIFDRDPKQQAADRELAPDFREGSQFLTSWTPFNPIQELGLLGKVAGATPAGKFVAGKVAKVAAPLVEKGIETVANMVPSKALAVAKGAAAVGEKYPVSTSLVTAPAKSLAMYEATAPPMAALSADAEGHRGQAFWHAIKDPAGVVPALIAGAVIGPTREAVLNSSGAQKRDYLMEHGGIDVGPFTAGKGGVLDNQLAGVERNGAGVGQAGAIGMQNTLGQLESDFQRNQGYPYRGGKKMVREAREASVEAASQGKAATTAAIEERKILEKTVKRENLIETAKRADQLVTDMEQQRRTKAGEPMAAALAQLSEADLKEPVDATHAVELAEKTAKDSRTPHDVRAVIEKNLELMKEYATAPSKPAELSADSKLKIAALEAGKKKATNPKRAAQLDEQIAALQAEAQPAPTGVRYIIPADQLNGFRGLWMNQAGVGHRDRVRANETPLRATAFALRDLVAKTKIGPINERFHEAASGVEGTRESIGLNRQQSPMRKTEVNAMKGILRTATKGDPTAIPGELAGNIPEAANVEPLRQRVLAAEQHAAPVIQAARAETKAARDAFKEARARKAKGDAAALEDRTLLGLNPEIGLRKTDINQGRLLFGSVNSTSEAAGSRTRAGVPAGPHPEILNGPALGTNLPAFRRKYPNLDVETRLPELLSKSMDLELSLGNHSHGDIYHRLQNKGLIMKALTANIEPFQARALYGPAKRANPVAVARGLGFARGAANGQQQDKDKLGTKAEAYIELQKGQGQ